MGNYIESWNKRFMSRSVKKIMLKSVAQVMPMFVMSVFLLPLSFCEALERRMNEQVLVEERGFRYSLARMEQAQYP